MRHKKILWLNFFDLAITRGGIIFTATPFKKNNLKCDLLVSIQAFAFKWVNLYRYIEALKAMKEGDAEIIFLGTGSSMPSKHRNVTGIFFDQPALGSMFMDVGEGSYGGAVPVENPVDP
jgi:hypothetical protein